MFLFYASLPQSSTSTVRKKKELLNHRELTNYKSQTEKNLKKRLSTGCRVSVMDYANISRAVPKYCPAKNKAH